jgi:hypothetical protein
MRLIHEMRDLGSVECEGFLEIEMPNVSDVDSTIVQMSEQLDQAFDGLR